MNINYKIDFVRRVISQKYSNSHCTACGFKEQDIIFCTFDDIVRISQGCSRGKLIKCNTTYVSANSGTFESSPGSDSSLTIHSWKNPLVIMGKHIAQTTDKEDSRIHGARGVDQKPRNSGIRVRIC